MKEGGRGPGADMWPRGVGLTPTEGRVKVDRSGASAQWISSGENGGKDHLVEKRRKRDRSASFELKKRVWDESMGESRGVRTPQLQRQKGKGCCS